MNTSNLLTPDDRKKDGWVDVIPVAGVAVVETRLGRNFKITLSQDTTITFNGQEEGRCIVLKVTQGGAGGWTLTPSNTGNVSSFSSYIFTQGSTYLNLYFDSSDDGWNLDNTSAPASSAAQAFPVGSIFISAVSTDPATLLGYGTWSAIGAGKVLIGQDTNDTDFDVLGETGGAKTVASSGTNTAISAGTPAGVIAWPVGVPTFSGSALGTHAHQAGTLVPSAHAGTAVADHSSHTHTYTDVVNHTHTVTGVGSSASGAATTLVGTSDATSTTAVTSNPSGGVATGTTAGPSATLTHSVTQPNAHTMSGTSEAVSAGTPAGTIAWPAGVPTFTGGGLGTHNHTFTGSPTSVVQPYLVCCFWQRTA